MDVACCIDHIGPKCSHVDEGTPGGTLWCQYGHLPDKPPSHLGQQHVFFFRGKTFLNFGKIITH